MKTILMPVTTYKRLIRRNIIDVSPKLKKRYNAIYSLHEILNDVAEKMDINVRVLVSKCREREYADARCIYAYRARKYTPHSLTEIGRLINRDHATILHYLKLMQDVREVQILYNKLYHNEL